jgi:hypothetical protein
LVAADRLHDMTNQLLNQDAIDFLLWRAVRRAAPPKSVTVAEAAAS